VGWPGCALVSFACLWLARDLPAGIPRAVVSLPIVLSVPGALTVAALFGRRRIDVLLFSCLAVLLSIAWSVFASLLLYALAIPISLGTTYLCLLAVCAGLALTAQVRLLARLAAPDGTAAEPGLLGDEADASPGRHPLATVLAAFTAGALLLAGGGYVYAHAPRSAPAGYTWIAWSGQRITGVIDIGPGGTVLPFQVKHHDAAKQDFSLAATWSGTGGAHRLASPLVLHLGPDKEISGSLSIPAPPGGCTYRITVTLTQLGVAKPRSWTINADVRQHGTQGFACAS
jgi:hypothetical protein